jgi:hypothetical protein
MYEEKSDRVRGNSYHFKTEMHEMENRVGRCRMMVYYLRKERSECLEDEKISAHTRSRGTASRKDYSARI